MGDTSDRAEWTAGIVIALIVGVAIVATIGWVLGGLWGVVGMVTQMMAIMGGLWLVRRWRAKRERR